MPHTTNASSLQHLEDQLAELGFTVTTTGNPAPTPDALAEQITNGPRRIHADLRVGDATATVFIAGFDFADGLVLAKTSRGVERTPTDDTPAKILSAATRVAALVHLDGHGYTVIEVHPGDNGRFYLHDPADHTRFGPADSYSTRDGARLAASVADHDAIIVDR